MKKVLIATGVAVLAFASVAGAQGYMFNTNLTVGATGADVSALQTWLMANGFNIPSIASGAAAKGYFGAQTAAAVKMYQSSKGIPNTGFVGPLTRAALNGGSSTPVASNCMAGWTSVIYQGTNTCLPPGYVLPGSTPTTGTATTITTPGVEGTLAATQSSAGISSTIYEGQTMAPVLGIKLEAKNSDILVQRIKLDLGTATTIYNKIYSRLYVTDGSNTLASTDLNSSTVIKDGSNYYITVAGFSLLVPKGGTKSLVIKADVRPSIDSTDLSSNYTIACTSQCVRGVDGAGIDQYAGTGSITKTINVDAELASSATLLASTNKDTPKSDGIIATEDSSEDSYGMLTLLGVDFKAEKDDVTLTDLTVDITKAGTGGATASTTVYLFDSSGTEIDNATYSNGSATFDDIDLVISKDTTKTLWVKVDVVGANGTVSQIAADIDTADIVAENSLGDSITESGSAQGETMYVRNIGPVFTINSKSATRSSLSSNDTTGIATSTGTGTFNITVKALGGPIVFGGTGSTTPAFSTTSTTFASVYKNGAANGTVAANTAAGTSAIVSYSVPTSGVTTSDSGNTWTLSEGNSVTLNDVTFQITVSGSSANSYAFQLNGIRWYNSTTGYQNSTSMTDKAEWRTSSISLP